jgi:hypothetical protein
VFDGAGRQDGPPVLRAERLDRRADDDARQRGAVELGCERLADAVDRAVEPGVLGGQLVESADRLADAAPTVGGERCEQREQRQREQERVSAADREREADRRQARVDRVDGPDHLQRGARGDAAAEPLARGRDQQVDDALGGQREHEHGPAVRSSGRRPGPFHRISARR